ncbi:MAG: PHP-associated domain-containing protein [bacterium]
MAENTTVQKNKKRGRFTQPPPAGHVVNEYMEFIPQNTLHGYGKIDYHIHTSIGDAIDKPEDIIDYVEKETDLDLIAITDHDQIKGAARAKKYAEDSGCRIKVIIGEEVSTLKGHLIGLFMKKRIKRYTGLADTLKEIHAQGGIAIVPHPLSWLTTSVGQQAFKSIMSHKDPDVYFDAVELINPAIAGKITDSKAQSVNKQLWKLSVTGGSDSHSKEGIGDAYTLFPGKTEEDFRRAIKEHKTFYGGNYWTFKNHWDLLVEKVKRFKVF